MVFIKGLFEGVGFWRKVLLLVFAVIAFGFSAVLSVALFTDGHLQNLNTLRTAQVIESVGIFLLPSLFLAFLTNKTPLVYLGLSNKINGRWLFFVLLLACAFIPFVNLLASLNQMLSFPSSLKWLEDWMRNAENSAAQMTNQLLFVHGYKALMLNLFMIALLPAFVEELFFRGTLQKLFAEKLHPVAAIWIAALIFSAFHLQFFGFLPRLLLGALLGYVYYWTGSLWYPVCLHFFNNAIAVVFYFLKYNGYTTYDIDKSGGGSDQYLAVISLVLSALLIWIIYRKTMQNQIIEP